MSRGTIYSLKELAEDLSVTTATVTYHIKKGNLKADKVSHGKYKVQPEDIRRYLTKKNEEKKKKCSECYYHNYFKGVGWGCGYNSMENKLRGCSPVDCKRFRRANNDK